MYGVAMTTLVCRVLSRLPVAHVALYGTLDTGSVVRMMVTLRDCLADAPAVLLLDMRHVTVASEAALRPLMVLVTEARMWPAARVALCCANPATTAMVAAAAPQEGPDMFPDVTTAVHAANRMPVPPRDELALSPAPEAPAKSRQFTHDTCTRWGVGRVAGLAELVASELVTNAVVHARTPMTVTLRLTDNCLHVAVRDGDPRPMRRPNPGGAGGPGDEHGRGLLLLDAMADSWGCNPTADGKVVWASIALPGRRGAASDRAATVGPTG
jgi:hypothetical protein